MGRFQSDKKSPVEFSKFPVTNGTRFSEISGKEDNLARYTGIFGNVLPEICVPFNFPPVISEVFGRMVRFSEIGQFPDVL